MQGASTRGGRQRRQLGHELEKRGRTTKIHLAVDAHGLPLRIIITQGITADYTQAGHLMEGITAEHLITDKGYDSETIVEQATSQGMHVVILPRKNRTTPRQYDQGLYKLRHLVENAFLQLKHWREIATRYAKHSASFLAAVYIRCIALWAAIS